MNNNKKSGLAIESNKNLDLSQWYRQVITRSEMIDYYDISGYYILRPYAYSIWEQIQSWFDLEIKKRGVRNAYFPMFVSEKMLSTERDHIEGFKPEVAWVTRSGQTDLKEPIALRPTSETIMYPYYSKWIRSHRDLPLKLNQWANVVRWEFKQPTPFIRTREFLWQEGHTAFETLEESETEVMQILNLYRQVYEDLLAVPVIMGRKTENEKFPGALYTTTVECFIPESGRAIQAATSHCLGQNFARMFDIKYEDKNGKTQMVWQNSWGLTTRSIGIMVMTHGDQKGLILPPRIAPYQFVLIPLLFKNKDNYALLKKVKEIYDLLIREGFRGILDDSETHHPGYKFNQWELKGVPLRLVFGPTDLSNNTIEITRRDIGTKENLSLNNLIFAFSKNLDEIHKNLLTQAKNRFNIHQSIVNNWNDFIRDLDQKKILLTPWCQQTVCEQEVNRKTKELNSILNGHNETDSENQEPLTGSAKTLCVPFEHNASLLTSNTICFHCGQPAQTYVYWGRSY